MEFWVRSASQWVQWVPESIHHLVILECIIEIDILNNWKSPNIGSMTSNKSCYGRKDQVKDNGTASNKESSKPGELPRSWSNAEVGATFKYLKETG